MAKKKGSTPANTAKWFVRRFDVVRLSFAGKSGHYTDTRKDYESWAVEEGATIADLDSQTEILVVLDKGATSSAEKKANKLNQQGAAIVCFSESQWREKFEPSGDEMLELIRAGKAGGERLATLMERCRARYHGTLFDLQDANLKGCDLTGLDFSSVELSGSDLRQATVETLQTGLIENVRLEQAVGDHFRPGAMKNCSCKGAEFSDFFLGFDYHSAGGTVLENCDFSNAKLHDAYFNYSSIRGTLFKKSDLTGSTFDFASIAKSDFSGANLLKVSLKSIKCGSAVVFRRAKFTAANLQRANLKGADCTGADFSGALLTQADFSGAKIEGANFKDAQLVGASFDQTNVTKAKNLNPPTLTTVKVGAACRAIATAFKEAEEMEISATVKTLEGEVDIHFGATYRGQVRTKFTLRRKGQPDLSDENETKSLSTALKKQGEWWGQGELQFETIGVKSSKSPLKGKPLQEAVAAALAEVFNAAVPSQDDAKATRKQQKQNSDDIKAEMLAELRGGAKGIKAFSKRDADELTRKKLNRFRKEDFGGLKLDGLKMLELDFQSSNFSAGSLKRVKLEDANLRQSDFSDADLSSGDFDGAKFHSCNLQRAKLTKANLVWTSFSGANLSEADLAGANLTGADLSG